MDKIKSFLKCAFALAVFAVICSVTSLSALAADLTQKDAKPASVTISWEKPDNETNCVGYYVGYGETPTAAASMVENKKIYKDGIGFTSHVISGLKPGTKYYVCIGFKAAAGNYVEIYIRDAMVYTAPGKVTNVKQTGANYFLERADVNWKTQTGVSGYEYILKNNAGKIVKRDKIPSATESLVTLDVSNSQFYSFAVRAYSDRTGTAVYGAWSDAVTVGTQPVVKSIKASSSGIKLTWNKMSGAANYNVYVSTSAKKGYKKAVTTKKTSCTIKKVNGKKVNGSTTYYVYVTAKKGNVTGAKDVYVKVRGTKNEVLEF